MSALGTGKAGSKTSRSKPGGSWWLSWFRGDKKLILLFIAVDLCLVAVAHQHFSNFRSLTRDPFLLKPSEVEAMDLTQFQELANQGAWDALERLRLERVAFYQNSDLRPSMKTSFYFFPELLPASSLERQFVMKKIQPTLQALKAAHLDKNLVLARSHFALLQVRIANYEVGGIANGFRSLEAQKFLQIYQHLAR